ncbi:SPOR domain-containing protein [uncultured Rhodospira sp.]|uniref:SPOR domain-containing protein n=1 Tax=uncultured Rhodospira sp. TaxID=1936189 RepID=UPI00261C2556|nr:SPOR domain-containing protein [uncultured Rhodospira sp.]
MAVSRDATGLHGLARSPGVRAALGAGALCLTLALGACGTGLGGDDAAPADASATSNVIVDPPGRIAQAPLPSYAVGDRYVFDNPEETWVIRAVDDDTVTWESDLGGMRVTPRDPLMPSLRSASPEVGVVRREVQHQTGSLWPLEIGKEASFLVSAGMEGQPAQSLAWNCRVVATTRTEVPAGAFNTYKVACVRSDGLRLYTYHAPTVGYFVRREVTTADDQQQARSLLAVANSRVTASGVPDAPAPEAAPAAVAESTPLPAPPMAATETTPEAPTVAETPVGPAPTPTPTPRPTPAAAPAAPPSTAASADAWTGAGVRLGSFRTMAGARKGWATFQASHPDLLQGLSPRIQPVDLDDMGSFFRVYAGPFPSKQAARGLCGQIPDMGSVCDVQSFN